MSETTRMWVEIVFNVSYLFVIWGLVGVLMRKRAEIAPRKLQQANLIILAFALLAFGDTGHVGLRVLAYALGGLESRLPLSGVNLTFVGLGALMTAVTVTFFYVVFLFGWKERFSRKFGWFEYSLIVAAVLRLILMAMPENSWNSIVPPQPFSTIRNLPLIYLGLGAAYLILREAREFGDKPFTLIGVMILVSFACYLPVILFVQQIPMIGMLMIPKTMAYVAIGFIAYVELTRAEKGAKPVSEKSGVKGSLSILNKNEL